MVELKELIEELIKHCEGCPYFSVDSEDGKDIYRCEKLIEEYNTDDEDDDSGYLDGCGDEDILFVVEYDLNGNITDFELLDFYPETCERNKK